MTLSPLSGACNDQLQQMYIEFSNAQISGPNLESPSGVDSNINLESLWFFHSDLNLEQMHNDMRRYQLQHVFAITKSELPDIYYLYVYQQVKDEAHISSDRYSLSVNCDGTIALAKEGEPIVYHSLEEAIKEGANAFIPYCFVSSLEKEGMYIPDFNDMREQMQELQHLWRRYNLALLTSKQIVQLGCRPETFIFCTSQKNQLLLCHIRAFKGDCLFDLQETYPYKKEYFDSNFQIKITEHECVNSSKDGYMTIDRNGYVISKVLGLPHFLKQPENSCLLQPQGGYEKMVPFFQFNQKIQQFCDEQCKQTLCVIDVDNLSAKKIQEFTERLAVCPAGFFVVLRDKQSNLCLLLWNKVGDTGKIVTEQLSRLWNSARPDFLEVVTQLNNKMPLLHAERLFGFVFGSPESDISKNTIKKRFASLPPPIGSVHAFFPERNGELTLMVFDKSKIHTISCSYKCNQYRTPKFAIVDGKTGTSCEHYGILFFDYERICNQAAKNAQLLLSDDVRIQSMDKLFDELKNKDGSNPFAHLFAYLLGFKTYNPPRKDMTERYTYLLTTLTTTSQQILKKYYVLWTLNCCSFNHVEHCVEQVNSFFEKHRYKQYSVREIHKKLRSIFSMSRMNVEQIEILQTALKTYLNIKDPGRTFRGAVQTAISNLGTQLPPSSKND